MNVNRPADSPTRSVDLPSTPLDRSEMLVCGVDISARTAAVVVVTLGPTGDPTPIASETRKLELADPDSQDQVKSFKNAFETFLRGASIRHVVIRKRTPTGTHAGSGLSFKLEGLIQMTDACGVSLLAPQTIASILRKRPLAIPVDLRKYQEDAFKTAAAYLLRH